MQLSAERLHAQRGQTMPFWVIGVLVVLTGMFFLSNYVNAVVWQIRAQNAADSFASTGLAVTANLWNEESTILYSEAVDENRVRYLNQALLNTIAGVGCTTGSGGTCDSDYISLRAELAQAVNAYDMDLQLLRQGNNFTEAGQQVDQRKMEGLVQSDCPSSSDYSCAFVPTKIAANMTNGGNDIGEVDYVACKTMNYFGSALLYLGSAGTYQVIGRGAAAVVPAQVETFDPGTQINPTTGAAYQPTEHWAAETGYPFDVDYTGLQVNLNWYAAGTIQAFGGNLSPGSYGC